MLIEKDVDVSKKPTKEQIAMLHAAAQKEVVYDADSPELSDEELMQFRRISEAFNKGEQKKTVTLRISAQSLQKAKLLGRGYTSILAKVLEHALQSPETLEKSLRL